MALTRVVLTLLQYASVLAAVLVALTIVVRPTLGYCGIVLLIPFLSHFIPRLGPGLNAETALFLLGMVMVFLRARPPLPPVHITGAFVAYFTCALFGLALTSTWYDPKDNLGFPFSHWVRVLKSDLWPTLLFFMAYALAPTPQTRRLAVTCLIIGLPIQGASSIFDFFRGSATNIYYHTYRAVGVLAANPNVLGGYFAVVSVLPLTRIFRPDTSFLSRSMYVGMYLAAVVGLVLTQSRTAWLAFVVAHAVWLFYTNRKLLIPAALAAVLLLATAYALDALPRVISDRIEATLTPGSTTVLGQAGGRFDEGVNIRVALYQIAGEMFVESPVWGHGFRGFELQSNKYGLRYGIWKTERIGYGAHSIFASVAVDHGLLGLLAFGWMVWMLLRHGFRLVRSDSSERYLGVALLSACAAVATTGLAEDSMFAHEVSSPFWVIAGLAVRACRDQITDSQEV